jgi:hypothetical protein
MLYDFETVRLFIHQPRLNHVSEWALTVEELQAFGERAQEAAASVIVMFNIADCEGVETLPLENFTPGEKQCRFCKASAICTARQQLHFDTIAGDFVDLTQPTGEQLAEAVKRVPLADRRTAGGGIQSGRFYRIVAKGCARPGEQ